MLQVPLRVMGLCLGSESCDLCPLLDGKPFASVILSSMGVSLHLFTAAAAQACEFHGLPSQWFPVQAWVHCGAAGPGPEMLCDTRNPLSGHSMGKGAGVVDMFSWAVLWS